MENISQSGVCLNLRRRFECGTGLTIELPATDTQDSYVVLAKVVHVRRLESESYLLGCKFISELSEDEMQRLLSVLPSPAAMLSEDIQADAAPTSGGTKERRSVSQVHLQLAIGPETTVTCLIQHFSASNHWPLGPGTVGTLKGYDMAGEPWKLKVKVRECLSRGDVWSLECRLVKAASRADLLRALGGLLVKR